MAAPRQKAVSFLLLIAIFARIIENGYIFVVVEGTNWCVVRSAASTEELQTALDFACGVGAADFACGVGAADCAPIQSNGLCYLPNTIQAHASYAFNSYYQKMGMAPGSCDFAGTATISQTDPSYGSCVYPSSASYAGGGGGGAVGGAPTYQNPFGTNAPKTGNGGTSGVFPVNSKAFSETKMIPTILVTFCFLAVFTLNFQPI